MGRDAHIFRVKVNCITSVDGIILWLLIWLVNYVAMFLVVVQLNRDVIQDYVHPDDQTQPTFEIYIYIHILSGFCKFIVNYRDPLLDQEPITRSVQLP